MKQIVVSSEVLAIVPSNVQLNSDESTGHSFVLFTDPQDEEGNVYAYRYDEDGNLNEVTEESEWEMCQEVLGAFSNEDEEDEA